MKEHSKFHKSTQVIKEKYSFMTNDYNLEDWILKFERASKWENDLRLNPKQCFKLSGLLREFIKKQ